MCCNSFGNQSQYLKLINALIIPYTYTCTYKVVSSPELKAQVSFSDHLFSVVRLLIYHIFIFFLRTTGPISTKLGTKFMYLYFFTIASP